LNTRTSHSADSGVDDTRLAQQSPEREYSPSAPPPTAVKFYSRDDSNSRVYNRQDDAHECSISAIPTADSSRTPSDVSPESAGVASTVGQGEVRPFNMSKEEWGGDVGISHPATADDSRLETLSRKCRDLSTRLVEAQHRAEEAEAEIQQAKEEAARRTELLERRLAAAAERESKTAASHKEELENALVRIQAETRSLHEASVVALREQHRREVACLKDEIEGERKRCAQLMAGEKATRERAEGAEVDLRQQLAKLNERCCELQASLERETRTLRSERSVWSKERRDMERVHEQEISRVLAERDESVSQAQEESKRRVAEMTARFNSTLKDIEHTTRSGVRQELEAEKMLAVSAMQKKCSTDVEEVRMEERSKAENELKRVREAFLVREKQTAEDLHSLEKLHADHIDRLEKEVESYKDRVLAAEREAESCRTKAAMAEEKLCRETDMHRKALGQHTEAAQSLEVALERAQDEVQSARARETLYRERLSEAVEENRLQHAELLGLRRQSGSDAALAESWRSASKESAVSLASYETALEIAREEVIMLEHNMRRLEEENSRLREALQYADNIVYGSSSTSSTKTKKGFAHKHGASVSHMSSSASTKKRHGHPPWKPATASSAKENVGRRLFNVSPGCTS